MTNDKDLFSQINELFDSASLDEASELIGDKIQPSQKEKEKELIEKLNRNEIEFTEDIVDAITDQLTTDGEIDPSLTEVLREHVELKKEREVEDAEDVVEEVEEVDPSVYLRQENPAEVVEPQVVKEPEVQREDYISKLGQTMSQTIARRFKQSAVDNSPKDFQLSERIDHLNTQVAILRNALMESSGRSMVSGIGNSGDGSTPGSGEVRINNMDDVHIPLADGSGLSTGLHSSHGNSVYDIPDGSVLVWDENIGPDGGWTVADGASLGGSGGTIQEPQSGRVSGCKTISVCGDLYWGSLSAFNSWNPGDSAPAGATLVERDVKSIQSIIAFDYNPQADGNFYSDTWTIIGLEKCDGSFVDNKTVKGISGPFDTVDCQTLFIVYSDPDACVEGLEGCSEINVPVFDCQQAVAPGGELRWGTADESALNIGELQLDNNGDPITGVTGIVSAIFEGCDEVTRKGRYNIYYVKNGQTIINKHSFIDTSDQAVDKGIYIANASCVVEQPPVDNTPVFCQVTPCAKTNLGSELVFSDGTNNIPVLDDAGNPITDAIAVFAAFSYDAASSVTGNTGTYNVIYKSEPVISQPNPLKVGTCIADCDTHHPTLLGVCDTTSCDNDIYFGKTLSCHKLQTGSGELAWSADGTDATLSGSGLQATEILATFTIDDCSDSNFDITDNQDWYALYKDENGLTKLYGAHNGLSPVGGYKIVDNNNNCVPGSPEQPAVPGPLPYITFGCQEVSECGDIYFGTPEDYNNGVGNGVNLGVEAKSIESVVATEIYDNTFSTFKVLYKPCGVDTFEILEYSDQALEDGNPKSFYILPSSSYPDSECVSTGETGDPFAGLITGCKETDKGGTLHWGTQSEAIDDNFTPVNLQDENGNDITCKGIILVYSLDAVDPGDNQPGKVGTWHIVYENLDSTRGDVLVFGRSGPVGPEGAYMRALPGSTCVDDTTSYVSTRDVVLVNSVRYESTRMHIMGDTGNILYNTQEEANLLLTDLLRHIHNKKPTVHVTTDINLEIKQNMYVPQTGDLWIDPSDYTMYVCHFKKFMDDPRLVIQNPEEYMLWVELASGGVGSNGGGGSNITLSDNEPVGPSIHGDLWIDAETYIVYAYNADSRSWISLTGDMATILDKQTDTEVGSFPPTSPKEGDLWFDDEVAEMRIWYYPYIDRKSGVKSNIGVWIPINGAGYQSIPTTTTNPDTIIDEEVAELKAELTRLNDRIAFLESYES